MFGDIGKMMKIAAEMKQKMPEMKARLEQEVFTASSGGGCVSATVNGKMQITDIKLEKSILSDDQMDVEMLEDLIKAAVSAAQSQAAQAAESAMKELTGGMDIPGLDGML